MTIPTLAAPTSAELAVPYVTPATFQAFPTWLDLDNLIPGGVQALQTDELAEVGLAATEWAIDACEGMRLDGHFVQGENQRTRLSSSGRPYIKPRDIPLRAVTALSWGADPSTMTADTLPDSSMWIEDGREVSFIPGGGVTQFNGPAIQFGSPVSSNWPLYVTWSYVAGYPNSTLQAPCVSGATSIQVADPTSILPGDVLRLYDVGQTSSTAGANEAITVASTYVPALPTVPPVPASIPLAAGTTTAFAHEAGIQVTGFPRGIMQGVICYEIALLMREDVADEVPQSRFGPASRSTAGARGGQAGGLVNDALGFLARHRPVWRS
jgi:hypothetical protein